MGRRLASIPVSFFSIAVGLLALANAWRVAGRSWPEVAGAAPAFTLVALVAWLAIVALYAHKWRSDPASAQAELRHPVQSAFVALVPVSSLLAALALAPFSRPLAVGLFSLAVVAQLALGVWLHGRFWQGGRAPESVTPAVYLPAVAQNFVAATAAASLGWHVPGELFFGVALFSWLALESMVIQRAAVHDALAPALRPTLGIQLAPPVVGGVSWMTLNGGVPDTFAMLLLGYGLYQALVLLRLLPWILEQAFSPSYWAFSFGVAALPTLAMRMAQGGAPGLVAWLAPVLFAASNLVFALLIWKTATMGWAGRLLPQGEIARSAPG